MKTTGSAAPRGHAIHYRATGDGPAILLLHGFGGTGEVWRDQGYVDALVDQFLVITPHLLGHGESDKPHDGAAYTHEGRAIGLAAVLDALDVEQAHVWGYSMGGRNAYGFAVHQPDRTASVVVGGAAPEIAGDVGRVRLGLTRPRRCHGTTRPLEQEPGRSKAHRAQLMNMPHLSRRKRGQVAHPEPALIRRQITAPLGRPARRGELHRALDDSARCVNGAASQRDQDERNSETAHMRGVG